MLKREELTALVRKAQAMDPDAMNTLFEECRDPIYYFALKTVQNPEAAEDIAQEAMIDIFRNLEKLKDPAAFQAWSREITYRQCLHHIKKTPDVVVSEDEDGHSIFDTLEEENIDFIPDAAMESKDFQKTVQDMVNSLPAEQRSAILLYHFDGLSVKEIAQIQGVPENTVKSRLMYGRKAIKSSVEDYEKKNGVKLHSFAIAPFLAWLLAREVSATSMPAAASASTATGIGIATGVSVTAGTTTATVVATTAAKASLPIFAKVAAGVAAFGVAVGGVAAAFGLFSDDGFNSPQYESAYMEIHGESHRFQKEFQAVVGDECAQYIQTKDDAVYHLSDPETNVLEGLDVQEVVCADNTFGYIDSQGTTHLMADGAFRPFPDLKGTVVHSREGLMYRYQVLTLEGNQLYSSIYNTDDNVLEVINNPISLHDEYQTYQELRFSSSYQLIDTKTVYYARSNEAQILGSYTTFLSMDHHYTSPFTVDGEPVTVRYLAGGYGWNASPVFAVEGDNRNLYTFGEYSASAEDILQLPDNRKVSDLKQVLHAGDLYLFFKDGTVYLKPNYKEDFVKLEHLSKLGKQGHIKKLYLSYDKQEKDLICLMDDHVLYRYDNNGDEACYRLLGTYKGTYEAKQGKTGLTLTVFRENGEYKAIFHFYPLPGKDNSDEGKYYMTLRYDEDKDCYVLRGSDWIEKPGPYSFVHLTGSLTGKVLEGEDPTVFSVTKR